MVMIGNKLKALRVSKGLTQEQFAGLIGISRQTFNQLERNRLTATPELIDKIENSLKIKLDDPRIEKFMNIVPDDKIPAPVAA